MGEQIVDCRLSGYRVLVGLERSCIGVLHLALHSLQSVCVYCISCLYSHLSHYSLLLFLARCVSGYSHPTLICLRYFSLASLSCSSNCKFVKNDYTGTICDDCDLVNSKHQAMQSAEKTKASCCPGIQSFFRYHIGLFRNMSVALA